MPEASIIMAECVIYLANAPKNNSTYEALGKATHSISDKKKTWDEMRPREDYRSSAAGPSYVYPHSFGGYVMDSAF